MLIKAPEDLRIWLTKEMAPICDAEPAALAKYVLALLKKDKPEQELIDFCVEQLYIFLSAQAKPFVEKLFCVIKENSYMPHRSPTPVLSASSSQASKTSSKSEEKKRESEEKRDAKEKTKEDEKKKSNQTEKEKEQKKIWEAEPEKKAPETVQKLPIMQQLKSVRKRISPPVTPREEIRRGPERRRSRSRSPRERRAERTIDRRGISQPSVVRAPHRQADRFKIDRKRSRSPYDRQRREKSAETEIRKKKRCRDYDEKGYCMKGDQCAYDHGPDPVVVDDIALEKMVSSGAKGVAGVAQITANFSVPPPGYTPLNPPPPGVDNVYVANSTAPPPIGGLSEGYNPESPALSATPLSGLPPTVQASIDFTVPPPPLPPNFSNPTWQPTTYTTPAVSTSIVVPTALPTIPYDPAQPSTNLPIITPPQVNDFQPTNPVFGLMTNPRRGGKNVDNVSRGGLNSRFSSSSVQNTISNRTLQVRKIPSSMNNITKLNEHFAQFGNITNIQVSYDGDPEAALITYASRPQAVSAYKSTTPILNNRFIKVFWHVSNDNTTVDERNKNSEPKFVTSVTNPRGSLMRTVHIGGKTPTGTETVPETPETSASNGTETVKTSIASRISSIEREKYIEVRRKRKMEKEARIRLFGLQQRKAKLLEKEIEHQKTLLKSIEQTTNREKKKCLYEFFLKVGDSIKQLESEMKEAAGKLLEEKSGADDAENTSEDVSEEKDDLGRVGSDNGREFHVPFKKSRVVDSTQSLDNRPRVVMVTGFTPDIEGEILQHMGNFGELVDMDSMPDPKSKEAVAFFTYKRRREAEQAVSLGADCPTCPLTVQWAPKGGANQLSVVPDEQRKPSERVTPAALLATCPLEESDEEGNEN